MGKVGASILGGTVGFFTGGVSGAIAGAAAPWVEAPPTPPAPVTGITGMGTAQPALPTMTGSGLGAMPAAAVPGVATGSLYGAPAAAAPRRTLADRLAGVRANLSERLAALRMTIGVGAPPVATVMAAAPAPSPYLAPMTALAGYLGRRPAVEAVPRVESIWDQPSVSPSGVVSIF